MKITIADTFAGAMKRLPPNRQQSVGRAILKFQAEPRLPGLDFRALAGAPGYFIIDPHKGDRIVLRKEAEDHFTAVDVGPHDNVYRRWNR